MNARIKQRPVYKRVVLLFDSKPQPFWRFTTDQLMAHRHQSKVIPVAFDGTYWIECLMLHGCRSQRVVRHGWPKFDAGTDPDTDPAWPAKIENSQDVLVRDLRVMADRPYLSILSYWPLLAAVAGMFLLWQISGWLFLGAVSPFLYWLGLVIKGGVGNVPIAKDILGIHRPFLLTPYQLDQHVSRKMETKIDEGAMSPAV